MDRDWTEKEVDEALSILANEGYDADAKYFKKIWKLLHKHRHKCKMLGDNAVTNDICMKLCRYHLKDCHWVRNLVMGLPEVPDAKLCGFMVEGHCNTVNSPIGNNELCNGKKPDCPSYWVWSDTTKKVGIIQFKPARNMGAEK